MIIIRITAVALLAVAAAIAVPVVAEPVENVSPYRHGNLARAQDLSRQAFDALTAAQQANEFDLGGHAGRAKGLLEQANREIKLAAQTANRR